jgi:hypothetical protein
MICSHLGDSRTDMGAWHMFARRLAYRVLQLLRGTPVRAKHS